MIRRVLVQSDAHKAPQRQRVRQPPGNPALRPDALEIPDQQRPKVNPRRQRRTPVLGRIELRTPLLDKLVEALGLQQLIQTLIKRMPWSRRQLGVRDPDLLLLLPLLARPHRHAPILQTNSVDTVKVLAYEPGLAPRAVRHSFLPIQHRLTRSNAIPAQAHCDARPVKQFLSALHLRVSSIANLE